MILLTDLPDLVFKNIFKFLNCYEIETLRFVNKSFKNIVRCNHIPKACDEDYARFFNCFHNTNFFKDSGESDLNYIELDDYGDEDYILINEENHNKYKEYVKANVIEINYNRNFKNIDCEYLIVNEECNIEKLSDLTKLEIRVEEFYTNHIINVKYIVTNTGFLHINYNKDTILRVDMLLDEGEIEPSPQGYNYYEIKTNERFCNNKKRIYFDENKVSLISKDPYQISKNNFYISYFQYNSIFKDLLEKKFMIKNFEKNIFCNTNLNEIIIELNFIVIKEQEYKIYIYYNFGKSLTLLINNKIILNNYDYLSIIDSNEYSFEKTICKNNLSLTTFNGEDIKFLDCFFLGWIL